MVEFGIGIDLGTSYCCMAVYRDDDVKIIPNMFEKNTTPSYVQITHLNAVNIGEAAKDKEFMDPKSVVYDLEQIIGRSFNDPAIQNHKEIWPFDVVEDNNTLKIQLADICYRPEQILSQILMYLKNCAEGYLGHHVNKAVITVPAYFNDRQQNATTEAARIAGLEILQIVEPTAAAIAYRYKSRSLHTPKNVLVFDLGIKTFDAAVLTIKDNCIQLKAIGHESQLGGQDIDQNLVSFCLQEFKKQTGIDLTHIESEMNNFKAANLLRRLQNECKRKKEDLSSAFQAVISMDAIHEDIGLAVVVSREKFESINEHLFQRCCSTSEEVITNAGLRNTDIDEVYMIGGSTKIPKIQELVKVYFSKKAVKPTQGAVACGAAIFATSNFSKKCSALKNIFTGKIHSVVPLPVHIGVYVPRDFHLCKSSKDEILDELVIGIDLGTTYSCVAVYRDRKVVIIPNEVGENTTPSYVEIDNNNIVAGPTAKAKALTNPKNTVYEVKRLIGRRFNEAVVQKDMKIWPFKVIDDNNIPKIYIDETSYHPETVSAHILRHLKTCADTFLNCNIKKAVITVPAYFNYSQRQATKDAGTIAGLEVVRIINEPSAAAIAYCYKNISYNDKKTVLVFDFGGGTFDVVVMTIKHHSIQIHAVGGDTHLGGQDIDRNLVDYCLQEFKTKSGVDVSSVEVGQSDVKLARLLRRLKNECEEQKINLSGSGNKVVITLDAFNGDTNLVVPLTKDKFEELNKQLFQKCFQIAQNVVEEAGLTNDNINEVIMVGGSSRIPKIKELVKEYFPGKLPNLTIRADEAVASGAAILAAMSLNKRAVLKDIRIRDVVPLSIGIGVYTTNPRSFVFSRIILKNTPIPCSIKKSYPLNLNDDRFINVYEGESEDPKMNHWIGRFVLKNLAQSRLGKFFDVFITVSEEGMLDVSAYIIEN